MYIATSIMDGGVSPDQLVTKSSRKMRFIPACGHIDLFVYVYKCSHRELDLTGERVFESDGR